MWWQQYKKELMGHRGESLLIVGALLVWTLYLLSRVGVGSPGVIAIVYWAPMGFLPLWVLWTAVQLYRHEWRENTSYLMLSLPVRAWVITSAKLAVLVTGIVGFSLLIAAGGWIVAARTGVLAEIAQVIDRSAIPAEWIVKVSFLLCGVTLASLVVFGLVAQFAYVFSRLFSKFQGLVMVWTWILVFWLMGRAAHLGGRFLGWLPDVYVRTLVGNVGMPEFHLVKIESGPFVAMALVVVGLFVLLNAVLEKAIEV